MTTRDVTLDKRALRLARSDDGSDFTLSVSTGDESRDVTGQVLGLQPGWVRLRVGGKTHRARVLRRGQTTWVSVAGESYRFDPPARRGAAGAGAGESRVEAPMPGVVLEVLVAEGDIVEQGQDLLVVEAMKMEHRLRAGKAGVVKNLVAVAGERVDAGVALLEVEAQD